MGRARDQRDPASGQLGQIQQQQTKTASEQRAGQDIPPPLVAVNTIKDILCQGHQAIENHPKDPEKHPQQQKQPQRLQYRRIVLRHRDHCMLSLNTAKHNIGDNREITTHLIEIKL